MSPFHKMRWYVYLYSCPELNRCQIDLNDLNRLVQKLHTLELDKAVSNGELKRIISMQVRRTFHSLNAMWLLVFKKKRLQRRCLICVLCLCHRIFHLRSPRRNLAGYGVTLIHLEWWARCFKSCLIKESCLILGININSSLPLMLI